LTPILQPPTPTPTSPLFPYTTLFRSIIPTVLSAQRHSITFEDYIALMSVSDPQLSPDGKWVAYTVSTPSLQDNRNDGVETVNATDRKSTRLNSSHDQISYAVFCLKKK